MSLAFAALREMASGRSWPIMALCALGWALVIAGEYSVPASGLCLSVSPADWSGGSSLAAAAAITVSAQQAFSCFAMLLAMMTPLVWQPLAHVWDRSLTERRVRAVLLFLAGYFGAWMLVVPILALLAVALRRVAGSDILALPIAVAGAILWQATPVKARFLRRCHVLSPLPVFGLAADVASLRFGAEIAGSCIGACWAIMLVPFAGDVAHLPLMAITAALMLSERYAGPYEIGFPARRSVSAWFSGVRWSR